MEKKSKSGWGGRRVGAGRPRGSKNKKKSTGNGTPKNKNVLKNENNADMTPLEYLLSVMRDETASDSRRMKAAVSAAQYMHPKIDRNKKLDRKDKAKRAAERFAQRYAPGKPPTRVIPFDKK